MSGGFELFTDVSPTGRDAAAKIHKDGVISLPKEAWVGMGSPERVELMFHKTQRIVALRPARGREYSYPVRKMTQKIRNRVYVTATAFCKHYDIETPKTKRFDWRLTTDKMVVLCDSQTLARIASGKKPTTRERNGDEG